MVKHTSLFSSNFWSNFKIFRVNEKSGWKYYSHYGYCNGYKCLASEHWSECDAVDE